MSERVLVTGIGVVTSLGSDLESFWAALLAGKSGIQPVTSFDASAYASQLGGEVPDFCPEKETTRLDLQEVGRASQFAVAAARRAIGDAGIEAHAMPEAAGVSMGTTSGEPREIEVFNDSYLAERLSEVGGELAVRYPCHSIPGAIAAEFGLQGPNTMIPTACAAGNYAAAHALECIRSGRTELMLAGGSDSFSRITFTGFARLGAIATEKCQPFDRNRQGMVPGEGAAVLVLESETHARQRGARIYAEVAGYGLTCDAHHMTGPDGKGAMRAMRKAIADARIDPGEIDYVSAHGTGTPANDRTESAAIREVFGDATDQVPVSSIKSMLGHTMGAASALEAAACALAIQNGVIPPTINFEEPDPECDIDCVPNQAREVEVQVAMNNAYAFGGNNASLILRSYP